MMSSSLYLVFEYMEHDLASLAAVQTTKFSEAQKLLWMILKLLIERMFGLEGLLNDPGSGWKLVYVDFESDVLLVGDDPWEEFVGCVRCIRILSPCEVKQMGEEGMQLLNSAAAAMQQDLVGGAAPKD